MDADVKEAIDIITRNGASITDYGLINIKYLDISDDDPDSITLFWNAVKLLTEKHGYVLYQPKNIN